MRKLFSPNSLTILHKREKNLKKDLSPSPFPPKFNKNESLISSCNQCDTCKNYLDNKYLAKNLSARLLVECAMIEVAYFITSLMSFTLFLVIVVGHQ